jgi:hypothetical protein
MKDYAGASVVHNHDMLRTTAVTSAVPREMIAPATIMAWLSWCGQKIEIGRPRLNPLKGDYTALSVKIAIEGTSSWNC